MITNFEFLGSEPIENVITCMNFKIDKVVFFGYYRVIQEQKKVTERFLKENCGVQNVVFHSLSQDDLQSVLAAMRKEIQYEYSQKNKIFFDVTGGESLILVAFGMLSREFETPMHMYDIIKDKLIELEEGAKSSISKDVAQRKVPMTLELYVKMRGGIINDELQKGIKALTSDEFSKDVECIYDIAKKYWDYWNPFASLLRSELAPEEDSLDVNIRAVSVIEAIKESRNSLKTIAELNEIIDDLAAAGVLLNVQHADGNYRFTYKNKAIKYCLWDGGSILELHIYREESKRSTECRVGVHLDWDGEIHGKYGVDVLNEIDVLSLEGNIPTFISCKSGKMGGQQTLYALYELETVASRFGGKYAKKVLVTTKELVNVYMERAREMGIEVR